MGGIFWESAPLTFCRVEICPHDLQMSASGLPFIWIRKMGKPTHFRAINHNLQFFKTNLEYFSNCALLKYSNL